MLRSAALDGLVGIRHGFFTREGGISEGIYASLNCGFGSGDDAGRIARNRAVAAESLSVAPDNLVTVFQCHSPAAVIVERPWRHEDSPEADAMATAESAIAIGILTADCAPVLLADAEACVVGAAHAGWKGALGGVLEATVAAMEELGAEAERMVAAVGPCIGPISYEVGPEFRERFMDEDAGNEVFFQPSERGGHHLFDLGGYAHRRLRWRGVGTVEMLGTDTYADEERFFSYRRATHRGETDYGRNLSAIVLEG